MDLCLWSFISTLHARGAVKPLEKTIFGVHIRAAALYNELTEFNIHSGGDMICAPGTNFQSDYSHRSVREREVRWKGETRL